ncbi:MAG TPA: YciI family protein [Bacteroidales bacterium]|mgnify:CR=1 FL=1|nr:hypothetical protein [Bacteroidales bacterium]HOU95965.1 YciI family protein [Bacteroidales bacterium]HQG36520.1 YciI family protein [Bacteroidales bacterium]HQG53010.1 YciI family protein [Bacteroidales bacterium]HQJ20632.1 YciI family protein [Bacteroidales bacterium]
MQFLLIAHDGTNPGAEILRTRVRPLHLENISKYKKSGEFLFGGAIFNNEGKMVGSMIVYDVSSRERLDEILKDEPYVYESVWQKIEIVPFQLANIK